MGCLDARRLSIGTKILLLMLGLALPPLLLVGWLSLSGLDRARETAVAEGTQALRVEAEAALMQRVVDEARLQDGAFATVEQQLGYIAQHAGSILTLSTSPGQTDNWIAPDVDVANVHWYAEDTGYAPHILPQLATLVHNDPLIHRGYVALEADRAMPSNDSPIVDQAHADSPFDARKSVWYTQAQQAGATIWTDVSIDVHTQNLIITAATPIYTHSGDFVGVVGFDMFLQTIGQHLFAADAFHHSHTLLVEDTGEILMHSPATVSGREWDAPLIMGDVPSSSQTDLQAMVERMASQDQGVAQIMLDNTPMYVAFAPIATTGWRVAQIVPVDAVIRPAMTTGERITQRQEQLASQFIALLVATVLGICGVSIWMALSITRPIRALRNGAKLVASGRLNHQLPAAGHDEIGQLVHSFNAMTSALQQNVEALEANAQRLTTLNTVSNELKMLLDLPRLLETIAKTVCDHFAVQHTTLYLVDDATRRLEVAAVAQARENARPYPLWREAKPISLDRPSAAADAVHSGQLVVAAPEAPAQSWSVYVPILGREERVIGLLLGTMHRPDCSLSMQDTNQLLTFATMAGLTIENVRLYDNLEQQVAQRTEELRVALEQVQLADRRKSDYLAAVSHELRTPLNAIIGFSRILLDDVNHPLSGVQREDMQSIHRNGHFLLDLISDLLDLARIEAGHLRLEREPIALGELIHEVVNTSTGLLRTNNVALYTDIPDALPYADADTDRVRQILLNLLSNAIKFTDQGSITVSATTLMAISTVAQDGQPLRVYDHTLEALYHGFDTLHEEAEAYIAISVSDTGIGIPPHLHANLFEEFSQFHEPSRKTKGTGLGLAIVRRLVELHNGDIWVESTPHVGSTFTFTLPICAQQSIALGDPQPVLSYLSW